MTNKLAFKHKDSLVSKEKNEYKRSKMKENAEPSRLLNFVILPIITCSMFIGYWFILCPLLWAIYHSAAILENWHVLWSCLFWLIALLIWIFIMIILILIWERLRKRHAVQEKLKSYGTDDSVPSTNIISISKVNDGINYAKHCHAKKKGVLDDALKDDETANNTRHLRQNDVHLREKHEHVPLLIHQHVSINDEKNNDTTEKVLNENEKENSSLDSLTKNINRHSMQDYLKLVTVTQPEEEESAKSPTKPMSPRELFFIDLIKEAEKAELNNERKAADLTQNLHFFPDDLTLPSAVVNDSSNNINMSRDVPKESETSGDQSENELRYFIAEVKSSKHEKTEVFLEINTDENNSDQSEQNTKKWLVHSDEENSVLISEKQNTDGHL